MAKYKYVDLIKATEDENTINSIGKIDIDFIRLEDEESLYYIFPLIERIVLEIYKMIPNANVEQYEQGTMKTIISIIESNKGINILPDNLVDIIRKYFEGYDCLRNKLFHPDGTEINEIVSFEELHYVIFHLLSILKKSTKDFDNLKFDEIEYLS